MKTRLISLQGRHSCGKTKTLNFLIDLLEVQTNGGVMPVPCKKDRRKVFKYKGLIVGITTAGDTEEIIKENCKFFKENNCDIAFSACLTRGRTCDILDQFIAVNPGSTITPVKKILETNTNKQEQKNFDQATDLQNMI